MRAALRRKREVHKKLHTHTQREIQRGEQPGTCARLVAGRESGGGEEVWEKRINIDRFWKVGRRRTAICSRSQDARWGKKKKKNSGKA